MRSDFYRKSTKVLLWLLAIGGALFLIAAMTQPAWSQKINLATQVTGFLPGANGGLGMSTTGLTGCPQYADGVLTISASNCETITGAITGSGATTFIPLWLTSTTQGNSPLSVTAGVVTSTDPLLATFFNTTAGYKIGGSYGTSGQCLVSTGTGTGFGSCGSGGGGTVTSFAVGTWPSWLTPAVTNATTTPSLGVTASAIPHSAIAATAVTPGSYTNANITVAADGSVTAAANGTAGSSGLSGMTAGQIPIAATSSTVTSSIATSSIPLAGDVTGTTGASTVAKIQTFPVCNATPITGESFQWTGTCWTPSVVTPGANNYATLQGFGTSVLEGWGSTSYGQYSFFALLAGTTTAPPTNNGIAGSVLFADVKEAITNFIPDPFLPSAAVIESGENDTAPSGAAQQTAVYNAYMAADAYLTIPQQDKMNGGQATPSGGTWSFFGQPLAKTGLVAPYDWVQTTTSGASLTFSLSSTASSKIGITFHTLSSSIGTFTVTIDGTAETDNCSGTTTFTAGYCGSFGTSFAEDYSREEFSVTPNTTHTIVVTSTSSNNVGIVGVDWIASLPNVNLVLHSGVIPSFSPYATMNPIAQSVVTALHADGWPVYYVDVVSGTPGVNATTDVSGTATMLCPATANSSHPNNCGHLHYFQTIINTLVANHLSLGSISQSGAAINNTGAFSSPLNIQAPGSDLNNMNGGSTPSIPHWDAQWDGSGGFYSVGMVQTASSSFPWSAQFVEVVGASDGWSCTGELAAPANPPTLTSCVDGSGNTYQQGIPESIGTPSVTGCTLSALVGGNSTGSFASGVSGTCTIAIVVSSLTARHGYYCSAKDITTPADTMLQTAYSTTGCTLSGTTVSGDTILWNVDRAF